MSYPKNWVTQSLKDWGMQAQSGFASGVHNAEGNGVIHLRPMNVSRLGKLDFSSVKSVEDDSARRIKKGDILFNNTNSAELVGKTAIVDVEGEFAFSNHMTRLRFPADKVDHKYMSILLHSYWMSGYFNEICSNHVNQASVSIKRLEQVEVSLPLIAEQHKIVEFLEDHLSRLDAALADVKQAKLKAAQFRRSLLQTAFTGNLTGDGTRLMTELPDRWAWATIGEVCEKPKYGWTTSASDIGEVKLLRTTDLTHGPITWETVPFCKEIPKTVADYLVHPNDIFISRAGSVGVSVLVKDAPFKSVFASYLIRIRPTKKIESKYLSLFLQSPHYWNQVTELSSGIALANINATKIQSINLPLPPLPEQQKIVELLEDHLSRLDASVAIADAMEKQSASLRRSLLQAAFTGQLTKEVASV